jgi:ABC-2 type transport system permease protein
MIKTIWSIVKLDLLLWRRIPFAIFGALVPPIGMALVIASLSLSVLQQPVALVVEGHGPNSERMQKLIEADTDAYILTTTNKQKAQEMLDSQMVAAVITIPKDFEEKIKNYAAVVDYTLFNANIDFSDDIRRSIDRSVAKFDAPRLGGNEDEEEALTPLVLENEDEEEGNLFIEPVNPYRVNIEKHNLRETSVDWFNYQVIPVLILLIMNTGLMGTAQLCAYDIEKKTAKLLMLAPQKPWIIVLSRLISGTLVSIIVLIPCVIVAILAGIFNPPANHWPWLIAVFLLTSTCSAGIGALIGSVLKGSRSIAMAAVTISTYLFFLGGGFTTISFLPEWLQSISIFVPFRYAIDGMREALFYPTLEGLPKDLIVLTLTTIITGAIGSLTIRKTWTK